MFLLLYRKLIRITKISASQRMANHNDESGAALEEQKDPIIVLEGDQPRHFSAMLRGLEQFKFFLDKSALGSGKTFTAMKLISELKLPHVIYISTQLILDSVKELFITYGLNHDNFITYQSLRSITGHQPRHGLLTRIEKINKKGKPVVDFKVTEKFCQMVREGCLLIVDEVQYIKNRTLQLVAVSELEREIIKSDTKSRVLEMSGAPVNKEEHCINLMLRYQIISEPKLLELHRGSINLLGARSLVDFCRQLEPAKTNNLLARTNITKKNIGHLCYRLYVEVVQKYISDSMSRKQGPEFVDAANGMFYLHDSDVEFLKGEIRQLESAAGYIEGEVLDCSRTNWSKVTKALQRIEISKTNLFIRLATQVLDSNPQAKVVIGLNYIKSIDSVAEALSSWGVGIIMGRIPSSKRTQQIKKFNTPDTECRVLITMMKIISTGIRLDDQDGNFPRTVFGSASYDFMACHQFPDRFLRGVTTKSSTVFRYVYGVVEGSRKEILNSQERNILVALSKSTDICKETLEEQVAAGVKFPGDFVNEIEDEAVLPILPGPYVIRDLVSSLTPDNDVDEAPLLLDVISKASARASSPLPEMLIDYEEAEEDEGEAPILMATPKFDVSRRRRR